MLIMERWTEKSQFSSNEIVKAKVLIPVLMKKYKMRVNRQHGDKLAIPKYYFLLHLVDDIERFAAAHNTNSGVGEANHKHNVKTDTRRTQYIGDLLDQQTGN